MMVAGVRLIDVKNRIKDRLFGREKLAVIHLPGRENDEDVMTTGEQREELRARMAEARARMADLGKRRR
jgi:hypothetical protein